MPRLYFLKPNQEKASLSLAAAPESFGTKVLGVRKIGGSKELRSKSLLELLGMMDDVGKQKAVNSLKSVDPQQSLGISHLGLDGYLRKAFELLERGFPHMEGSGITGPERVRLNELRSKPAVGDILTASEQVELEELIEKEEEEELETTSEYMGVENSAINASLATEVVLDKINALKGVFGSLTHPIGESVKTLTDIRQAIDYRKTKYAKSRTTMAEQALRSTPYSSRLTVPQDYDQYTENEAAGPLAKLISEDSGKTIERDTVLNAPNILRYLGKNPNRYESPHITDPLDYDIIEHGGKIYVAEVKGKSRGKSNIVGENKRKSFNEIITRLGASGKEVVPILLWPNEPPSRLTKSGKYYSHIPDYSYAIRPSWDDVSFFTNNRGEKTYDFGKVATIDNPKHKASEAAVAHRTERVTKARSAIEPRSETIIEPIPRPASELTELFGKMGSQQEQSDAYNRFLQNKGLSAVKKETIQGYISKKSFPDKAVKEGLYDYFLTPVKKKKKPTAAEKRAAKKAEDELLVAAIAEVDKKKAEEEEKRKVSSANFDAMYARVMAKKAALKK
jgi:hypothetical protein